MEFKRWVLTLIVCHLLWLGQFGLSGRFRGSGCSAPQSLNSLASITYLVRFRLVGVSGVVPAVLLRWCFGRESVVPRVVGVLVSLSVLVSVSVGVVVGLFALVTFESVSRSGVTPVFHCCENCISVPVGVRIVSVGICRSLPGVQSHSSGRVPLVSWSCFVGVPVVSCHVVFPSVMCPISLVGVAVGVMIGVLVGCNLAVVFRCCRCRCLSRCPRRFGRCSGAVFGVIVLVCSGHCPGRVPLGVLSKNAHSANGMARTRIPTSDNSKTTRPYRRARQAE